MNDDTRNALNALNMLTGLVRQQQLSHNQHAILARCSEIVGQAIVGDQAQEAATDDDVDITNVAFEEPEPEVVEEPKAKKATKTQTPTPKRRRSKKGDN